MSDPGSDERLLAASAFKAWGILATAWQAAGYALWEGAVEMATEESVPFRPNTDEFTIYPSAPTPLKVRMWQSVPGSVDVPADLPPECARIEPAEVPASSVGGALRVKVTLHVTDPVQMGLTYEGEVLDASGQVLYPNVSIVVP